jgi:tetratricopeptide (TPR) repeat protein
MTRQSEASVPSPTPEERRVAVGQFERANQVLATGNHDYGTQLLLTCCKLDPGNLIYRKALRKAQKVRHKNNLKGSKLSFLTNSPAWTKLKAAKASHDHLRVLECGEEILNRNPWDVGAQMDMAESAEALDFMDVGVWLLEQARHKDQKDATVNRALARLYERCGEYNRAIALWELVRASEPGDLEAQHKAKDLAASETIARGNYTCLVGGGANQGNPSKDTQVEPPHDRNEAPNGQDRIKREVANIRLRIASDSTNPLPYLQLAAVYRRADMLSEATAVLAESLVPTGNNFEIATEMADLETEPFRRNLTVLERKLAAHPEDEELRRLRVQLLREINSRELNLYRQKSERYPTDMSHRLELGIRLLRSGQHDAAIIELQAARADPRQRWRALQFLGHCFKSRKNWRLAERNFEEALQSLPASEETHRKELLFLLAGGAAEAGDLSKAIDIGYELANIDFGYRDIGKLLDDWQAKLQQA